MEVYVEEISEGQACAEGLRIYSPRARKDRLYEQIPGNTIDDKMIFILVKMEYKTRDIATIMHKSVRTIFRIKKKIV